jgi:S1-C subfamily serine protease
MQSVLAMHASADKEFAPRTPDAPKTVRKGRGCTHCHQVRERLNDDLKRDGKWARDLFYRYPLPENVGIELEVHRGNLVKKVKEKSPADVIGLKPGDLVKRINGVPIHSFGDAQFALDHAPKAGVIDIAWKRQDQLLTEKLTLDEGWRKGNISWRPSVQIFLPQVRLSGTDLTAEERKTLGLTPTQLAFRQRDAISMQARNAGILPGDIILGVDDQKLDMTVTNFQYYVQCNYFAGDRVTVNFLRDGERMTATMTLGR